MSTATLTPHLLHETPGVDVQQQIASMIHDEIASLPKIELLTSEDRRGLIARYTAVLEGNFIYWMTATYLAVKSEEARETITENLMEEVSDCHPVMLRKFAREAHALPTEMDALKVDADLTQVRLFLGRLQGLPSLAMMAFFEGWIQKFMAPLADLAAAQGSSERVYTDVHGVCDIEHSQELLRAVSIEQSVNPAPKDVDIFEGIQILRKLIRTIMEIPSPAAA